jgi:hypothetical protein
MVESKEIKLFNALNRANLGKPGTSFNSGAFGTISPLAGPRIMQLGAKVIFKQRLTEGRAGQ